jgi:hypothetical protein
MIYKDPSPAQKKKARLKTIEKEFKTMLEEEFLQRRTFHDTYSPYMCEKIIQAGSEGGGFSEMMVAIGVKTKKTFFKWLEDNQDFQDAYEYGQVQCQAFLEKKLLEGSLGQIDKFNATALNKLLASRFPEFKDATSVTKNEINIGSINSIEKMDASQLDEQIKRLTQQLGFNNQEVIESTCETIDVTER